MDTPRHDHTSIHICHSNAGYYLGIWCQQCGPYDRVSGYMREGDAQDLLTTLKTDLTTNDELESRVVPGNFYHVR